MVGLRGFIVEFEYAVSTHRGVKHAVHLLADAGYGAGKTLVEREEGHQCTQCHATVSADDKPGTQNAHKHIAEVPQVAVDGHDDVTDAVSVIGVAAQLLVDGLKLLDGLVFMAKDLDDFLTSHHLLDEAVDLGKLLLLHTEMLA